MIALQLQQTDINSTYQNHEILTAIGSLQEQVGEIRQISEQYSPARMKNPATQLGFIGNFSVLVLMIFFCPLILDSSSAVGQAEYNLSPLFHTSQVSGGVDNAVKLWSTPDVGSPDKLIIPVASAPNAHNDELRSVIFSTDGKTIVSGGLDAMVKIWSIGDGSLTLINTIKLNAQVISLAFSHNGKFLAIGTTDGLLSLYAWDAYKPLLLKALAAHSKTINALAFSMDDKLIASSSEDGSVKAWQLSNYPPNLRG
jgi:WD40 repeat protein